MNGDLKVKVAGETEVVVEGRVERREEGSSSVSSYSFRRRFSLPEDIDMTAITCIMSSDGILTISASKMVCKDYLEMTITYAICYKDENVRY